MQVQDREKDWASFTRRDLAEAAEAETHPYYEFLRVPEMSAGIYTLPVGATDHQKPHARDEIYHVLAGRARFTVSAEELAVQAGQVLYVKRGVEHRFHSITEDLSLLVIFAPAE